ncbi:MAG: hypothetical protein SGI74_02530 [Oligoflexia bacterium]|nr:hypothetical protein [Oligoflexia bacterium]
MKKVAKKRGRPVSLDFKSQDWATYGVLKISDFKKAGISTSSLYRLVKTGEVEKLDTGYYIHKNSELLGVEREFALACAKFGRQSVIGGLTALFYYSLIEQIPSQVWVLVPSSNKKKHSRYHCVHTKVSSKVGVVVKGAYRIVTIERALVEALRLSSKIGLDTAYAAIGTALIERTTTIEKVHAEAKSLKLEKYFNQHWEAIVAMSKNQ